jgi:hypothetical protein
MTMAFQEQSVVRTPAGYFKRQSGCQTVRPERSCPTGGSMLRAVACERAQANSKMDPTSILGWALRYAAIIPSGMAAVVAT